MMTDYVIKLAPSGPSYVPTLSNTVKPVACNLHKRVALLVGGLALDQSDIYNLAQELHILAQVTKGCVTFLKIAFEQNDRLISYVAGFK